MATDDHIVEKRTRFFDGQFLQDEDFNAEQAYHLERQRRHCRLLHVPGVAEGLFVSSEAPNTVTVAPGTAIDSDGRLLVLAESTTVELPGDRFNQKGRVELYLSYAEYPADQQSAEGSDDFTRWLERPQLTAVPSGEVYDGETPPVLLAHLSLDHEGGLFIEGVADNAGFRLPGGFPSPTLRTGPAGMATLTGSFTATDGIWLEGDRRLTFKYSRFDNDLKVQLEDGYGLGINRGTVFSAAPGKHSWRDSDMNERMALTTEPNGALTVTGTGTSSFAGPLQLRRDAGASRGPAWFLELYQDESSPPGVDVLPGVRFRHHLHFETTLEARRNAFHLLANQNRDDYADLWSRNLFARRLSVGSHGPGDVGADTPRALVDIQDRPRTQSHPQHVPGLYVTADIGEYSDGMEFRHSDGRQGIGFGYNSLYGAGTNPDQDVNIIPKGSGGVGIGKTSPWCKLDVDGDIRVQNIFVLGRMFFEPISNLDADLYNDRPEFSHRRAFWYFRRDGWNLNNMTPGGVQVHPSQHDFQADRRRQPSDVRLKDHICGIPDALDRVGRLRGVRFEWNNTGLRHLTRDIEETTTVGPDATEEENEELWEELRIQRYEHLDVPNIGLLAQDVETIAPELVSTDEAGFKSVDYGRLSAILVEAVKELHAKVTALESKESGNA